MVLEVVVSCRSSLLWVSALLPPSSVKVATRVEPEGYRAVRVVVVRSAAVAELSSCCCARVRGIDARLRRSGRRVVRCILLCACGRNLERLSCCLRCAASEYVEGSNERKGRSQGTIYINISYLDSVPRPVERPWKRRRAQEVTDERMCSVDVLSLPCMKSLFLRGWTRPNCLTEVKRAARR